MSARLKGSKPSSGTRLVIPVVFSFDAAYTDITEFFPNTVLAYLCALDPIPKPIKTVRETHLNSSEISDVDDMIEKTLKSLDTSGASMHDGALSIVVIIDAIDEVSYAQQKRCLNLLDKLVKLNSSNTSVHVRAIVFSRYDPRIQEFCRLDKGWQSQPIPLPDLREDILKAVLGRLKDSRLRISDADRQDLTEKIAARANDMFRLAGLYVDHLLRPNQRKLQPEQLEATLNNLPDDLDRYYDQVLERVRDKQARSDSLKALRWVLHSAETLTVEQLAEACSMPFPGDVNHGKIPIRELNPMDVIDPLSGLIRVSPDPPDDIDDFDPDLHCVTIAHFSVGEYLASKVHITLNLEPTYFGTLETHLYLAQACFSYFARSHPALSSRAGESREWALHDYTFDKWSYHVAAFLKLSSPATCGSKNVASLALKIRNSCLLPDIDLYDDGALLRQSVTTIMAQHLTEHTLGLMLRFLFVMRPASTSVWMPLELGQLRMLVLRPCKYPEEPVRCDLMIDAIENKPNYTFLSYVWGDHSHQRSLRVNGREGIITSSLLWALLNIRFRESPMPKVLWVDQLCINQSDSAERTHQLRQLSSIVGQARRVHCWLNPGDCTASEFPGFQLHRNKLWTRAWVMQELILGQDLQFSHGDELLSWNDVLSITSRTKRYDFPHLKDEAQSAHSTIYTIDRIRERRLANKPVSLEEVLFSFRHMQTSHGSDKVAAFLPLANDDASRYANIIDYAESWTRAYTRFAAISLLSCNALDVLAINNIDPCSHGLPSWVPCWMDPIYDQPLAPGVFRYRGQAIFGASPKQPCVRILNDDTLRLSGIQVDVVQALWSVDAFVEAEFNALPAFLSFAYPEAGYHSKPGPADFPIDDEDARDDLIAISDLVERGHSSSSIAAAMLEGRMGGPELENPDMWRPAEFPMVEDLNDEEEWFPRRKQRLLCETQGQRLGNVPKITRLGDIIVVFAGGRTPYVLRPNNAIRQEKREFYTFVGEW